MSENQTDPPTPRPFEDPPEIGDARLDAMARLLAIVDRLRAPDGCPWDREQTLRSLTPSLLEEAHEAVDAIETGDEAGTVEESGDLLMVLTLMARIAGEEGRFDFGSVARAVGDKLLRRHPHVFGDVIADGADEALANWERIKLEERKAKGTDESALAGLPSGLPALQRSYRTAAKAISSGFRWTAADGALEKLHEEVGELTEALESGSKERIESELGDVCLAAAILGSYLKIDPERATRAALRRFEERFRALERQVDGPLAERTTDELMAVWSNVKEQLAAQESGPRD